MIDEVSLVTGELLNLVLKLTQLMVAGVHGTAGVRVRRLVEGELRPDTDTVITLHHNTMARRVQDRK